MEKSENHSQLPRVEQDDILRLTQEEILTTNHVARWSKFAEENPVLAQEIIKRAYIEVTQSTRGGENDTQMQIRIMDTVTYCIRAMELALARQRKQINEDSTGVDGDDEDPQP